MMVAQEYFARPLDGESDTTHWQLLEDHLIGVANLARKFGDVFDSGDWAFLMGLWHDLGKYRQEFQEKLRGERITVEHSGLGAALAFGKNKDLGLPLAFSIAGHHTGLANLHASDVGQPKSLMVRLRENKDLVSSVSVSITQNIIDSTFPTLPDWLTSGKRDDFVAKQKLYLKIEFWIRFLFSALVDADRLDSESFSNPQNAKLRLPFANIKDLRERLEAFIDNIVQKIPIEDRTNRVNTARKEVLIACRNSALAPTGFFSLTVPTGGGKTLASMSFALRHAQHNNLDRVIVVIPYTSIIEQNAEVFRQALGSENVIEHQSNLDPDELTRNLGEDLTKRHDLACENWEAPVIVTTSVQFFETLFSNRTSRCRKLHNITRSVIVLDEVQNLPPAFLSAILSVLRELVAQYRCSVLLSTATQPALAAREGFEFGLPNVIEIIREPHKLSETLSRVEISWPRADDPPKEWDTLAEDLSRHEQVLAVVHRREDARLLVGKYKTINQNIEPIHLSALMCPAHRSIVINQIKKKLQNGESCCVVSTQLVEAGVDIDFPIVYRAMGGLDSVVQAAGRCNREGKLPKGHVVVFRAHSAPPRGTPRQAKELTESLLREGLIDYRDPHSFERYFRGLYFLKDLDEKNIQADRQQLNFATVGDNFRLIEDGFSRPIVVPFGDASARLEKLRRDGPTRESLRGLQPYLVNVYPDSIRKLEESGAVENIAGCVLAIVNVFKHLYHKDLGLVVGDEVCADPSSLVI